MKAYVRSIPWRLMCLLVFVLIVVPIVPFLLIFGEFSRAQGDKKAMGPSVALGELKAKFSRLKH